MSILDQEYISALRDDAGNSAAFRCIWMHKRLVLGALICGALCGATLATILPARYTATTVIMPPQQQQSSASAMLGQLGALATLGGRDIGMKNPTDLYIGLARSRTVADAVINKFDLRTYYDAASMLETRKALESRTNIHSGKDNLIKISVDDVNPVRASELANAYVEELQRQNSRLALSESSQRRLFFERKLEAERSALANVELDLKSVQQKTGILQISSQVDAAIKSIAHLRAEIAAREVQVRTLRLGATEANPEVVRAESELRSLKQELVRVSQPAETPDALVPPAHASSVGIEYIRAVREVKYHESLYEMLAKQYEAARLDEAKDAPIIQVVDTAVPPDQKSWPSRGLWIALGAVLGGTTGIGLSFAIRGQAVNPIINQEVFANTDKRC